LCNCDNNSIKSLWYAIMILTLDEQSVLLFDVVLIIHLKFLVINL